MARETEPSAEQLAQRLAVEQFRDDERHAAVGADVEHRHDVGVIERGRGTRLVLEAAQALGVASHIRRQDLDGDVAAEPAVAGTIDLAHPAAADHGNNAVRSKPRSRTYGHGGARQVLEWGVGPIIAARR